MLVVRICTVLDRLGGGSGFLVLGRLTPLVKVLSWSTTIRPKLKLSLFALYRPCFGLAYCVPFNNKTTFFAISFT